MLGAFSRLIDQSLPILLPGQIVRYLLGLGLIFGADGQQVFG